MNEEVEKKEWAKPEIVDLDVDKTAGGFADDETESSDYHVPGKLS